MTLLELTSAYGVLANGGRALDAAHRHARAHALPAGCCSSGGRSRRQVLVAPAHVAAMNDMLERRARVGHRQARGAPRHPAAGKTGTSQDFRDAWFVGYTAQLVGGVWVGNDDGRSMNRVMGGSLPARLWHDVMLIAHEGRAPVPLPGTAPASIAALARACRAQPAEPRASAPPLMPRERIGAEFIERATAEDDEPPPSRRRPRSRTAPAGSARRRACCAAWASGREPICRCVIPNSRQRISGTQELQEMRSWVRLSELRSPAGMKGALRGVAVQVGALVAQPVLGFLEPGHGAGDQLPEAGPVVHLEQMRHLVRGDIVEHVRRAPGSAARRTTTARSPSTSPSGWSDRAG